MNMEVSISVYRPQGEVKACATIIHGMCEHRKRYDEVGKYLASKGIGVVTYDQPGHGEDCDPDDLGFFGHNYGWDRLVDTAGKVIKHTKELFPDVPHILIGHSMGTIVARTYVQKGDDEIDGMVLSGAPNYTPVVSLGKVLTKLVCRLKGDRSHTEILDGMVLGSFNDTIPDAKTNCDWLSFNEDNVKAYIADPLCGFSFTSRAYADLMDGLDRMHKAKAYACHKPALPILFMAGAADPCTGGQEGLADSMGTLAEAGYEEIELLTYPHSRHEIFNDDEKANVMSDLAEWISKVAEEQKGN